MLAGSWQSIRVILALFFSVVTGATTNFEELYTGIAAVAPDIRITGEQYRDAANGKGFVYYGIKYGAAERFQPSVANTDYSYLANPSHPKQGYICPQVEDPPTSRIQSEDCLYLDVYVPPISRNQNSLFPIMMFIHGGGFTAGNKDMYNSTIFAAAINAIVVTVNYRLSAFGFLATGDQAAVGNWALYDLNLALNWIEENIEAFAGDTEKINIFGESAGAALVSALMLNNTVRGKVQSGLAMSGSVFEAWAITNDPKSQAVRVAVQLGCPTDTSENLITCLKAIPMDQLLNTSSKPWLSDFDSPIVTCGYGMVVDGLHIRQLDYFLNTTLPESDKAATFITWYMTEEAAFDLLVNAPRAEEVFGENSTIDYNYIKAWTPGQLNYFVDSPKQLPSAAETVMAFYDISVSDDKPTLVRKYIHLLTGSGYAYGALRESEEYANRPSPLQLSNQLCLISFDPDVMGLGAFHSMDLVYIFRGSDISDSWVKAGFVIQDHVMNAFHDILRDIAYNGSTSGLPFGNSELQNYLHLNGAGQWVNEKADFRPITKLYDSLRNLPYSSPAFSHAMRNNKVNVSTILLLFLLFINYW